MARKMGESGKQYVIDRYDNNLAFVDDELMRFLGHLGPNDTVMLISDHGEEFWDHGSVGHGHSLYDEMVRTPLLVRLPGVFEPGSRIAPAVSTADLVPTMTQALGLEAMKDVEGVSLLDLADFDDE